MKYWPAMGCPPRAENVGRHALARRDSPCQRIVTVHNKTKLMFMSLLFMILSTIVENLFGVLAGAVQPFVCYKIGGEQF